MRGLLPCDLTRKRRLKKIRDRGKGGRRKEIGIRRTWR